MGDALAVEEQRSILSGAVSLVPEPDTINKIVKRIRLLVTKLLPVQVDLEQISDATSSIVTPEVIAAFAKCGGDFAEAVPFCLLRAKATFMREGYINGPDYDECLCRATACEVLARRLIHNLPADRLENVMSTRFKYRERDGDESPPTSALETAIDQHCTIFLSSSEAQHVINMLWRGDWVQQNNDDGDIDYVQYEIKESSSFWDHFNPNRLSVPRYQTTFKICVWFIYLFVYSQTVQSPLEQLDPARRVDEWEYVLYIMTLSFLLEEVIRTFKTLKLAPKPLAAIGFWTVVSFLTDALLIAAFSLRVAGLRIGSDNLDQAQMLRLRSFQVLSCVAPLIWLRLLTVFDGFKIVGVLQLVVFRMLRESAIFFILLAIIGIGFLQAMYALDAADGESGGAIIVINSLIQALLGSPDFDSPNDHFGYPFGLIVYYTWNLLTTVILLNVLIALFGSAYADIEENATDEYLAFFAHRTVSLIRAPDSFVYPAPFNLLEGFLIAPLEYVMPRNAYKTLNRIVMTIVFFIPLTIIAVFETQFSRSHSPGGWTDYFDQPLPEDEDDPNVKDPSGDENGEICTKSFDELVKVFPNTAVTETAVVDKELRAVKQKMEELEKLIRALAAPDRAKEGKLVDVNDEKPDKGT